ncbi:hypothetical protein K443DRAFT_328398 [Laccaria amethystina LaAM-08-1]|jgi:hypothetical protein|uniref:Uncharacterized protein n=1 Tax=Laccaria amethystina LaAM-08-1 TaxID=1095629 RepID=A0A0C9Y6L4_9AGAR|nr:hypothetical protein K443DRAFT_328398 [Laccaria amethystina LaAM-08-1]
MKSAQGFETVHSVLIGGTSIGHSVFIEQRASLYRRTSDGAEGANFPFKFCTFSNARFQICNQPDFRGQGYLDAEFDTVDLLPQDLVNADVLRECSQSRDAERAAD